MTLTRTSAPVRTVVVTGASRGLGLALTAALSARGDRVVVDARDGAALDGAVGRLPGVLSVVGDLTDSAHRDRLQEAAGPTVDAVVLNAGTLGPSPLPSLLALGVDDLRAVLEANVVAQLGLVQSLAPVLRPGATVLAITSDAARQAYEGWGAYGASKAALEQLVAVLAVEQPGWRVLSVDPGDLRTAMHQAAFPGEDISDRPEPSSAVPGLLRLLDGDQPSGRYRVADPPMMATGVAS